MSQKRILIVDDAENNVMLLNDVLSELDYDIQVAKNGKEALNIALNNAPRLVLLDIMMPDMDGFELFEQLKQQYPETHVIFITAKSADNDRELAMTMGATDYITKPVNIIDILQKVQRIMEN
ncbi:MAG: response regulator [Salinivirgaceae bacterium]|nr:response regulator [Salinivirgaceae bacterium]